MTTDCGWDPRQSGIRRQAGSCFGPIGVLLAAPLSDELRRVNLELQSTSRLADTPPFNLNITFGNAPAEHGCFVRYRSHRTSDAKRLSCMTHC